MEVEATENERASSSSTAVEPFLSGVGLSEEGEAAAAAVRGMVGSLIVEATVRGVPGGRQRERIRARVVRMQGEGW